MRLAKLAVVCGLVGLAQGQVLDFQGPAGGLSSRVGVTLSGGLTLPGGSTSNTIDAGYLRFTVDGAPMLLFCMELLQPAGDGEFRLESIVGRPNPGGQINQTRADAIYALYNATGGGVLTTASAATAFQILLWEIIYDFDGTAASLSLSTGNLAWTGVDGTAFGRLAGLATARGRDTTASVLAYTNRTRQDVLVFIPTPGVAAMMGLGVVAASRRRR